MSFSTAQNGYGTISYINPSQLAVSFSIVVLFAVLSDKGLNHLELWAHKAGFQELFQRIYRELMVMGLASFTINIMSAASNGFFGTWEYAYYFSENIMFLVSTFFCLQGIGVMAVSLIEARSWDRASKISTEELLRDVETEIRLNSFSWRNIWYPFNTTRNQVEFRAFKMSFEKVYKIGGGKEVFNFGYFLRLTHQRNVISSIDITPIKWITVVGFVGLIAAYYELDFFHCTHSAHSPRDCIEVMSVYSFTAFGFLLVLLASILCYVARVYELRLLAHVGINSVDDYDIYLQTEERIQTEISKSLIDKHVLLDVLAQLAVEADIRDAARSTIKDLTDRDQSIFQRCVGKCRWLFDCSWNTVVIAPNDEDVSKAAVAYAHQASTRSRSGSASSPLSIRTGVGMFPTGSISSPANSINTSSEVSVTLDSTDIYRDRITALYNSVKLNDASEINAMHSTDSSLNMFSSTATVRRRTIFDVNVEKKVVESVIVTMRGGDNHKRTAESIKESTTNCAPCDDTTFEEHKSFLRTEMKEGLDYLKNFRSIFFHHNPDIFFAMVHIIMLCNALYIAWWITTLVYYLHKMGHIGQIFLFTVLSLTPPVLIFPLLTLLVRKTTLFKALMRLDPQVVENTLQKALTMSHAISALQQNLRIRLIGITADGMKLTKSAMLDLFDDINISGSMSINFDEFHLMLSKMNIHLSRAIVKEIFGFCDINNNDGLCPEEFDRLLFPDESAEDDKKNARYFDSKNRKEIASKGKRRVSDLMLEKSLTTVEQGFAL